MRNLKQALNHWLVFKTVHRVIKFNKKAWLKPYIDMNTKFKLVNNAVLEKLWKMWENIEILDLPQPKKRSYSAFEPNYHTTKFFTETLLTIEMRKIQILMNMSVYLGSSILDLTETVMYEFWYDYVKTKCGENAKYCCTDCSCKNRS